MFPAFSFLPTRMKAEFLSVSSPPLLTGRESSAPGRKRCCCNVTARTCERAQRQPGWGKGCQGDGAKSPKWLDESLKRGERFPGLGEQNCLLFFFFLQLGGFKCSLTICCVCSAAANQSSHTHTHTHVTKPKIYRYSNKLLSPHQIIKRTSPSSF